MSDPLEECTCFILDVKYHTTHYGATDPATVMEPNPDCPVHFPKKQESDAYDKLEKARRKVAKWRRKADKAVVGAAYQYATIKLREWEKKEEYWFERWSQE